MTSDTKNSDIILEASLQSFFLDQLKEFNDKCAQKLPDEALYYLSLVMDRFCDSAKYFDMAEGKVREKTLGVKLLESGNQNKRERKRTLKDVGDTALFLCGYFSESLNKKIVDTRYYEDLGKIAYKRLDGIVPDAFDTPSFFKLMSELFGDMALVMNMVSKQMNDGQTDDQFVLFVDNKKKAS